MINTMEKSNIAEDNPDSDPQPSQDLSKEQVVALSSMEKVVERIADIEPTALPVIKLSLFNFFNSHKTFTQEQLDQAINHAMRFSKMEKECSKEGNILPTIGIEIEVSDEILTRDRIRVLDACGIPNEAESQTDAYAKPLWEMMAPPSYSSWTQGQYLQGLADLGGIPIDPATGRVPEDEMLSLHLNFGIPEEIRGSDVYNFANVVSLTNNLIGFAYASPERIRGRKTYDAMHLKSDAKGTKKNKNESDNDHGRVPLRVELRLGEFRDMPTYRMLTEVQRIMAMLFSSLKSRRKGTVLTEPERQLSVLFNQFQQKVTDIIEPEVMKVGHPDYMKIFDQDKELSASIIENTDIQPKARKLIYEYSHLIAKVLGEGDTGETESVEQI